MNPAKREFIGLKVLAPGRLYLIAHRDNSTGQRVGYATFDDPTGGNDGNRTDVDEAEYQGPVRTLLAFSNKDLAEQYNHEELGGLGEPVEFTTSKADLGRLARLMLGGTIYWFCFDRKPGCERLEDRYTCWFIDIKLFFNVCGKYFDTVSKASKRVWTPDDGGVIELPDHVQGMLGDD